MMSVETFFDLFLQELRENTNLWGYYKFLTDPKKKAFRKAYFCQRLQYIQDNIGDQKQKIWDCGCGYGTTALFLALNGYQVYGTTLEYYYEQVEVRKHFWNRYGNTGLFTCDYADIFGHKPQSVFDTIILQDTLHHLQPLDEALHILKSSLEKRGKLLVVEENGKNIIQRMKLFRQRGFRKTIETWDEVLKRKIVFANEDIRGIKTWELVLKKQGFSISPSSIEFIRFFPPSLFRTSNYEQLLYHERTLSKSRSALVHYFYFGVNFIARQSEG